MAEPFDSAQNYAEEHVYNDTQKGVSVTAQVIAAWLAGRNSLQEGAEEAQICPVTVELQELGFGSRRFLLLVRGCMAVSAPNMASRESFGG